MGVYISGMEMPTHCMDCPFMVSRDNDNCILQSDEANEGFENWEQMKDDCPLIEIPPHGRLIDADAKVQTQLYDDEHEEWTDIEMTVDEYLGYCFNEVPTIIQADKADVTEDGES